MGIGSGLLRYLLLIRHVNCVVVDNCANKVIFHDDGHTWKSQRNPSVGFEKKQRV